jgi:hypothetical protein
MYNQRRIFGCGRSRGRVTGVIMKRNVFLSLILVCLLSACVATAQETRGAIVGRVSDPSGALIPGASLVVTNAAMGRARTASLGEGKTGVGVPLNS